MSIGETMNSSIVSVLGALTLSVATTAVAQHPHFGYSGEAAPANWGKLSPDWRTCAEGRNQSPIDLADFIEAPLPPLNVNYTTLGVNIVNNGHAVQVNYAKGSQVQADSHKHAPYVGMVHYAPDSVLHHAGETFELKQFHFHSPSEHTLNGKTFPMEMHLVHGDKAGNLAVVSVLMTEGATDNPVIAKLWAQMPTKMGEKNKLKAEINAVDLLPKSMDYFRYSGSLTTPPCSEGVRWYVMQESITVSKAQIEAFRQAVGYANNRPVQPVNARVVLQ
jgi:carbonic anhydrase